MDILSKHKKLGAEGFKNFVVKLETMGAQARKTIIQNALLEDPVYMHWILKNVTNFNIFENLEWDDVEKVLDSIPNGIQQLVFAIKGSDKEDVIASKVPDSVKAIYNEEYEFSGTIDPPKRHASQQNMFSALRNYQKEDRIPFNWQLPERNVLEGSNHKIESTGPFQLKFENDVLALKGQYEKRLRAGEWEHYYPNGQIMAKGIYVDGQKQGPWEFFFSDGSPMASGNYKDNLKEGDWMEYLRDGREVPITYSRGKKAS